MNRYVLGINLAHGMAKPGEHVALLVSQWKPEAIGRSTTCTGPNTPVINVLQNYKGKMGNSTLYINYHPTDADIGMARICQIKTIVFLNNGTIKLAKPEQEPSEAAGFVIENINAGVTKPVSFKVTEKAQAFPSDPTDPIVGARDWYLESLKRKNEKWYQSEDAESLRRDAPAAKPYSSVLLPAALPAVPPAQNTAFSTRREVRENIHMAVAYSLVQTVWGRTQIPDGNRVACVMVDPHDRIVSYGINIGSGVENPTWHGEIVTIRNFLESRKVTSLEPGYTIYTTLKPCHMCAGFIAQVAPSMKIVYGQDDPQIKFSTVDRDRAKYPQRETHARKSPTKSYPAYLKDLLDEWGKLPDNKFKGKAIPFLSADHGGKVHAAFSNTQDWAFRMDRTLRQHNQRVSAIAASRTLTALDLSMPSKQQVKDELWVLNQGFNLLKLLGAPIEFT